MVGQIMGLALLGAWLIACQPNAKNESAEHLPVYTAGNSWIKATLHIPSADQAKLALEVTPTSPITLHYDQLALIPPHGLKANITRLDSVQLDSGDFFQDTLSMTLIYDTRYHQEYGWVGTLPDSFLMWLDFATNAEHQPLDGHFYLYDSLYTPPKSLGARLFGLDPTEDWLNHQQSHWAKQQQLLAQAMEREAHAHGHDSGLTFDPNRKPFVHSTLPELSCGGLNLRLTAHQIGDSLQVDFRLVNHSPFTLQVPIDQLLISGAGVPQITPISMPQEMAPNGAIWVKKGERLIARLSYKMSPRVDSFTLDLTPIRLQEVMAPAFLEELPFTLDFPRQEP